MNVYLKPQTESLGIHRVSDALAKYKPSDVEIVNERKRADLVIIHVIGRREHVQREVAQIRKRGQKYVIIQYVLKSSMNPDERDWEDIWKGAEIVWSYYPLNIRNLYYAPLGVESDIFKESFIERDFIIATHGKHALSESVKECVLASKAVGHRMFHLGHELRRGNDITCLQDISDITLASLYSRCEFVSGLRRIEGFEQPVLEGLLCGARPIVFDRPEMKRWYNDIAEFITEGTREEVTEQLIQLFKKGARPVKDWEKQFVRETFNWKSIIRNMFSSI